ncbi:MAG: recombinase XerC [Alphaproteobacteria bacterium]|nr:MAG: recombinase XerC [Alphaproteobacteria bacterium]
MPEFNPINETIKKQYEEALLHGRGRDPKTVRTVWSNINLFENFTHHLGFKTFDAEQAKSFKRWLEKRKNQDGELLSVSTVRSTLKNIREFFEWLAIHPQYMRKVDGRAVQYLRLSNNANRSARASKEKTPPSLDELKLALEAMPFKTDIEKRDRAIFAFMILTCVRDDALVSLKRKHIDIDKKSVWQDPKIVRTKNRKGISTYFVSQPLPIAETIFIDWINHIDKKLNFKPNDPLFPKTRVETSAETMAFEAVGLSQEHWANAQPVRDIFKKAFLAVGLPYFNPHLFRNSIIKWGLKNLNQYEFKALSQNIGHEHAMTTYNSYAKLSEDEQREAIFGIGESNRDLQSIPMETLLAEIGKRAVK